MFSQKNIVVGLAVLVILVAVGAIAYWLIASWRATVSAPIPGAFVPFNSSSTRNAPPANIVVPEEGSKNVPANVAVPTIVTPSLPNSTSNFREFTMKADNNVFTPANVIGRVGDTIHIDFTSVDKEYDFTQPDYGIKVSIPKGQTKAVEFNASAAGQFTFYCTVCGGRDKGPQGYVIIAGH